MTGRRESGPGGLGDDLSLALASLSRPVPYGFADGAVHRFEAAVARQRVGRLAWASAAVFSMSAGVLWSIVLDAFGITGVIADSLTAMVSLMSSAVTVWRYAPVTGVVFTVALMGLASFSYAVLVKIGGPVSSRSSSPPS